MLSEIAKATRVLYRIHGIYVCLLCVSYVKCLESDFDWALCNFDGGVALFVAWIRFWIVR